MTNTQSNRRLPSTASGYELREQIGQGTCAAVYRAWCEQVQDEVAIKVVDLEWLQAPLEDIGREIQVMSLSSHPNVLPFSTAFIQGADLWVVMPLLTGGSVLSLMNCAHPDGLPENYAAYVLHCLLRALDYFHGNGQIHRDVKAANLMLDSHGNVMLSDYGMMGWMVEGGWDRKQRQTFVGTPCWMAPEVMEQASGYDYKADVWSLGITAIELAEGRAPYTNYAPMKVLFLTLQNPPPTLTTEHSEQFSQKYKDFVSQCLQKDPKERPTVKQLLKHSLFVPNIPKPEDLPSTIAKLPPIGSRGGSQKQLIRQLQKVSAPGSSGIHDRTAKGFGWDFGDGTPAQTSADSDTSAHSQSSQEQQPESTSGSTAADAIKRHASAPANPRIDDTNSLFGASATDTRINNSISSTGTEFAQGNDPALWSTNSLPSMHRSASTLSSTSALSAPVSSPIANDNDYRRNFPATSSVTSNTVPAKTVGLLKKGRFTVSDVVNPDKLGGKIDSFLDDDSSFFPPTPSSTISHREGAPNVSLNSQSSTTQPNKPPVHPISQTSLPRVQSATQPSPHHYSQSAPQNFHQTSQCSSPNVIQTPNQHFTPPIVSLLAEPNTQPASQNSALYSSQVPHPSSPAATSFPLQSSSPPPLQSSAKPNVQSLTSPEMVTSAMKPIVVSNPQSISYQSTRQLPQPEIQIVNPSTHFESQRHAQQAIQPVASAGSQSFLHHSSHPVSQSISQVGPPPARQPTEQPFLQYATSSISSPTPHEASRSVFQPTPVPVTRVLSQNGSQNTSYGQVDNKNNRITTPDDMSLMSEKNINPQSNTSAKQNIPYNNFDGASAKDSSSPPYKSISLPPQPAIVTVGEIPKVSSIERSIPRDPLVDTAPELRSSFSVPGMMSQQENQQHLSSVDLNDQVRSRLSNVPPAQADANVEQKQNVAGVPSVLGGSKDSSQISSRPITTSAGQTDVNAERDISVADGRNRLSSNIHPMVSMKGTSNPLIVTVDPELANRVVQGVVAAVTNTSNHHIARTEANVYVQSDGTTSHISSTQSLSATSSALNVSDLPNVGQFNYAIGTRTIPQVVSVGPDHSQWSKQLPVSVESASSLKGADNPRKEDDNSKSESVAESQKSSRLIESEANATPSHAAISGMGNLPVSSAHAVPPSGYSVNKQKAISNDHEISNAPLTSDKQTVVQSDSPVREGPSIHAPFQMQLSEEISETNGLRPMSPVVIAPTSNAVHQANPNMTQNVDNGPSALAVKRKSRFEVKDVPVPNPGSNSNAIQDKLASQSSQGVLPVSGSAHVPSSQQSNASLSKAKSRFEVKDIEQGTRLPSGGGPPTIVSIPPTPAANGASDIGGPLSSMTPAAAHVSEKATISLNVAKLTSMMSDLQQVVQELVAENEALRKENVTLRLKLDSNIGSNAIGIDTESSGTSSRSGSGSGMQSTSNPSQELNERNEESNYESQEQVGQLDSGGRATVKNLPGSGYAMVGNMSHGANVGSLGGVGHAQTVPRAQVQAQAQRQAVSQSVHTSGGSKAGTFGQDGSQNNSVLHGTNGNNGTAVFPGQMHHRPTHVSSPSKVSSGIAIGTAGSAVVETNRNSHRVLSGPNGHMNFSLGYETANGSDASFPCVEGITDSGSGSEGQGGNGSTGRLDGASNWND